MLDGILLGGYYTGNKSRVPIFLYSSKRMLYNYYTSGHSLQLKNKTNPVTEMV